MTTLRRILRLFHLAPLAEMERWRAKAGKAQRELLDARVEIGLLQRPVRIQWLVIPPPRPWWHFPPGKVPAGERRGMA